MRPNKKHEILDAAVALIEADGLDAVSYEALAEASDMSKSGIIYHFPSRYEIMRGIHQHQADQWEQQLEAAAGGPADAVDDKAKLRAMVLSLAQSATKAELLLEIDARTHPEFAAIWQRVDSRWAPSPDDIVDDDVQRARFMLQLLADGLWVHDYVHETPLTAKQRGVLIDEILQLVEHGERLS